MTFFTTNTSTAVPYGTISCEERLNLAGSLDSNRRNLGKEPLASQAKKQLLLRRVFVHRNLCVQRPQINNQTQFIRVLLWHRMESACVLSR